jgi:protein required for attachment to host cells
MKNQKKWLVVMGRKSAKIFSVSDKKESIKWLKTMKNPLGGERNRVMRDDKPGMSIGKFKGNSSPHALTGGKDPHEDVAVEFAKKVGEFIKTNNEEEEFATLTIAAESHMLGLIKQTFRKEKIKINVEWVPKDLNKLTNKKIEKIVFPKVS